MWWVGHVAYKEETSNLLKMHCTVQLWLEVSKERDHLGDLGIDMRIMLKYILEK
jgi:hypothetical protein